MARPSIEKNGHRRGAPTPPSSLTDSSNENELNVSEIALYDIDGAARSSADGAAAGALRRNGHEVTLTNRPKAVRKPNSFIFDARRPHGGAHLAKIPLKYDVIGQEVRQVGPSSFPHHTATAEIARDMENTRRTHGTSISPTSGIMTEAILKHTNLNAVGLCNNPINTIAAMAEAFHVEPKDVFLEWMGMNHVNWVRKVYIKGEDVTQKIFDNLEEMSKIEEMPKFDPELVRTLGVLPTYNLQYYYYQPDKVKEVKKAGKTRGETVLEVEKDLLKQFADPNVLVKPPELMLRGGARYSEAAVNLIMSLMLDRRDVQIVNARNGSSIADFPEDVSVEVPCVVGAHGVTPLVMGHFPESIRSLAIRAKSWESAVVKAAVSGSRRDAVLAMLQNPLVPDYPTAVKLVDEMLKAHKQYLPQFFKKL